MCSRKEDPWSLLLLYVSYFFQKRGVGVVNASPISMGLLSERGPPKWHPATKDIKEACFAAGQFCKVTDVKYKVRNPIESVTCFIGPTEIGWFHGMFVHGLKIIDRILFKEKEVDISKLALHFTLTNERIPTTLVSTARWVKWNTWKYMKAIHYHKLCRL